LTAFRAAAWPENDLTTEHQPSRQMIDCAVRLLGNGPSFLGATPQPLNILNKPQ
jgi:hypothetical protein